jgi:hypothetical protein
MQTRDDDGARPEDSLIRAFVHPDRQARLLALLGRPKGRLKIRAELAHFQALDPRYASRVPAQHQSAGGIEELLKQRGSPDSCYVLSEDPSIDAQVLPLGVALKSVVGRGMGTFISCLPGRLAYFEGEDPGERYMLFRER